MKNVLILTLTSITCAFVLKAKADEPFKARAEANWAMGSERSILMTEFWVPFFQTHNSVLYGDYRMMGDDQSNREFNVGVGYRKQIKFMGYKQLEGVAGAHAWFDRRHTTRGSKFNQITAGAEWFGKSIDVKLNGYLPLNDHKTHTQINSDADGAQFVGNQIIIDTDQLVREEALTGVDFELGWRVPFLDKYTDSTRLYGGIYHFEGDRAENITGWRTRIASDINPDI